MPGRGATEGERRAPAVGVEAVLFFWLLFNSEAFWHRGRHRAGAEWRRTARVAEMCSLKRGMNLTWSRAGKNKTCTVSSAFCFCFFFLLGRDANQANEPLRLRPRVRGFLGGKKFASLLLLQLKPKQNKLHMHEILYLKTILFTREHVSTPAKKCANIFLLACLLLSAEKQMCYFRKSKSTVCREVVRK